MQSPSAYIGLDVGGTMIKAMAFDLQATVLAEETAPTGDDGTRSWMDRARTVLRTILNRCPSGTRIGVAVPGLPAVDGWSIASMPGRLNGLENLNWGRWLEVEAPVPVFNDAQAALLGEAWLGAAKGARNVVLLTLGTGVGGAVMLDGRVLRGRIGRAGHLGHTSLNPEGRPDIANTPGSLEDAIGDHTLAVRSGGKFSSTRELVAEYCKGSTSAAEVWLKSVRALAAAIAGFVNILDPEVVVIGGGIANANEALFEPLQKRLDECEWRPTGTGVRLVKAALGPNAGATGAAYGARLACEAA